MAFDPSVSLGNLITIGSTGIGLIIYFVKSRARQDQLEIKVDELVKVVSEFRKSDVELALLKQKLNTLEEDMKTNLLAVHNQRLTALEAEVSRARDNIHLLANQMQVELFARKNEATARR